MENFKTLQSGEFQNILIAKAMVLDKVEESTLFAIEKRSLRRFLGASMLIEEAESEAGAAPEPW